MVILFEHAGGEAGLLQFTDVFDRKVLAGPLLNPLFGTGNPGHVAHLKWPG
jgi:hemoglobin